ncbi:MAG: hypothetical protein M3480_02860, partial [Verrucomicrobiota bacterium]|nr:hypothetical protein [Verrucomicrobiota bacterium]
MKTLTPGLTPGANLGRASGASQRLRRYLTRLSAENTTASLGESAAVLRRCVQLLMERARGVKRPVGM